ncbi:MAG: hypothetical protein HKM95_11755 [Inquilinus sp.]|nr:hypothetical protein [Inquilinus sp.]
MARLLRLAGAALQEVGGTKDAKDGDGEVKPKQPRVKPLPITPSEPPTYIKIVWDQDNEVPFYAGQRRYLRVETDANSDYHDADDSEKSRINIAVGDELKVFGTSPLKGGRMRIGVECTESVVVGAVGSIRIELYRKGLPALSDERDYSIVERPEPKEQERKSSFPDFEVIPVSGPEDDDWEYVICEDSDDTDVGRHASNFMMNKGKLHVYYSESFPRFATERRRFEMQNEAMANSFRTRYEMWLAVHSLLMNQDTEESDVGDVPQQVQDEIARQERCRHAVVAAMVAGQEVKSGMSADDEDAAVA